MKKIYKIFYLFVLLILLTTYSPREININFSENDNGFFSIKNIEVINNNLVDEQKIKLQLKNIYGKNIFIVDVEPFEAKLNKVDLINKVEFKKKYPNTIKIKIYEEQAIAVINKKGVNFIVMLSSKIIPQNENMTFNDLPSVFGNDSEKHLPNLINILNLKKFPIDEIKSYYFFQIGRWDIQLANEQIIKLPYKNVEESIVQINKLLKRKDFKKYKVIDLRISGKIITE